MINKVSVLRRENANSELISCLNKLKVEIWRSEAALCHDLSRSDQEGVQPRNLLDEARNNSVGFEIELDRVQGIRFRTQQFRIEGRVDKDNCEN